MLEHSDSDDLALSALGDAATLSALGRDAHLGSCARCRSELDQLHAVVASVRLVGFVDYPTAPPTAVWEAIVAELGLGSMITKTYPTTCWGS